MKFAGAHSKYTIPSGAILLKDLKTTFKQEVSDKATAIEVPRVS